MNRTTHLLSTSDKKDCVISHMKFIMISEFTNRSKTLELHWQECVETARTHHGKTNYPERSLFESINDGLVILKLNLTPIHALFSVQLLLQLEDVMVEMLLQLLIRKIDAQLLEGICLEDLAS